MGSLPNHVKAERWDSSDGPQVCKKLFKCKNDNNAISVCALKPKHGFSPLYDHEHIKRFLFLTKRTNRGVTGACSL